MNEKPIRIAQIMGKMNSGGVESFVMNYYRNIDRNEIQFDFIVDEDSLLPQKEEIEKLGGKIIKVPKYEKIIKYIFILTKILKKNNYKIVHSHLNSLSVFPLFCAYVAGVPVRIAHSHSTSNKNEKIKNIIKEILKPFSKLFATDFCACTQHAAKWLFGKKALKQRKIEIIPNAIDINKFKFDINVRNSLRNKLGIKNKFVIGHVGRFMKQKNHEFLIDIFSKIHKEKEDTILLLIGDGPLEEKIINKVKKLKLEESVLFIGTTDKVEDYMCAIDLFVFPSLYEGFGMVTIEAQCSGLPCIVSSELPDDVNVSNLIKFLPLNKKKLWIKEIIKAIDNPIIRNTNNKNIIQNGYDIFQSNNILQELYIKKYKSQVNNKRRISWIDFYKGIAIILVVIGHISENNEINKFIYFFHMPAFFFISGYLYKYKDNFIKKKFQTIIIPYLFFAIFSYIYWVFIERKLRGQSQNVFEIGKNIILMKGGNDNYIYNISLWFLPCIFFTEVIYYLINKIMNNDFNRNIIIIFISCIAICLFNYFNFPRLVFSLDTVLIVLGFFGLGNIYKNNTTKFFTQKNSNISLMIKILLLLTISIFSNRYDYNNLSLGNPILVYTTALLGISILIQVSTIFSNEWIEFLGRNSLIVLFIHEPIKRIVIFIISIILRIPVETLRYNFLGILFITIIVFIIILPIICVFDNKFKVILGRKKYDEKSEYNTN